MSAEPIAVAPADLSTFVKLLWQPDDVREVRIPARRVASGYFDDPDRLVEALAGWDGRANLYLTLNPVSPALLARAANRINADAKQTTSDADIVERRFLLVDIDPKRSAGISATNAETEAARDIARAVRSYLLELGWASPIVAMTGNGYALLYRIALANDPESTGLVVGVLARLAARFDNDAVAIDTSVSNAARIGCLVGSMKVKGDSTADRPHRRSALVSVPDTLDVVPVELLSALVPAPPTPGRTDAPIRVTDGSLPAGWVRDWLDRAGIAYREKVRGGTTWYRLDDCPFHPGEGEGDCGVGEAADGKGAGKCFHNRGAGRGWSDFRDALGLVPLPPIRILGTNDGRERSAGIRPPTTLIVPMATFLAEDDVPSLDVVPGVIPADGLLLWVGRKESFKSMTAQTLHVACATGTPWLGHDVLPMRSVYVSNEKRRRSVRERFRSIIGRGELRHEIGIVHRTGLVLDATSDRWRRFVDEIDVMNERVLVTLDTLTSLSPVGFKENTPEGMNGVLAALRMLTGLPAPATVNLLHHPAWADLAGKEMRGRGHSSLEGEHDGLLSFDRADREKDEAVIHVRPKDGDYQLILIAWDRDTMRIVRRDVMGMPLTIETAVALVSGLGGVVTVDRVRQALGVDTATGRPRFSDDRVRTVLNDAVAAVRLTATGGRGGSQRTYAVPVDES
jgi:AAA domain